MSEILKITKISKYLSLLKSKTIADPVFPNAEKLFSVSAG